MSSVIRYGLTASGRYLVVALLIPDRPGELARIVGLIAAQRANILAIQHHREGRNIGVLETEAELTLETRDEEHPQLLIRALADEATPCGACVDSTPQGGIRRSGFHCSDQARGADP